MSDILKYIDSSRNLSRKKTDQCNGLFKSYLNQQFVLLSTGEQDHKDLNKYLCWFLMQLWEKYGTENEPATVRNIAGSICRSWRTNTTLKISSILASGDCKRCRKKWRHYRSKEWDEPTHDFSLTTEEVEIFWKMGVFTPAPPLGLLKILFFYMSMSFGMRSGHYVCFVVICMLYCNYVGMLCSNKPNEQ